MLETAGDLLFLSIRERSGRRRRRARLRWEPRVNVGKDGGMRRKEDRCLKIKAHAAIQTFTRKNEALAVEERARQPRGTGRFPGNVTPPAVKAETFWFLVTLTSSLRCRLRRNRSSSSHSPAANGCRR